MALETTRTRDCRQPLWTCHRLPRGVDLRANQGDCKISLANLRNFPRDRGILQDKVPLVRRLSAENLPAIPPHI